VGINAHKVTKCQRPLLPKITLAFLKRQLSEYEEIKHQIKEITKESEKDNACTITSEHPANL